MSKQDGYSSRTAVDLERKYNFGKTFAEVYNLVSDAQRAAQEAQNAFDGLDQEQIFNLLTNGGKAQGIYRDDTGNVYVNASYIKSGKLAADYIDTTNLKVNAANITGSLTVGDGVLPDNLATKGEIPKNISELINDSGFQNETGVTNIVGGVVTTDYVEALGIKVAAANITGTLAVGQLPDTLAAKKDIPTNISALINDSGYVPLSNMTTIVGGIVTTDYVEALGIKVNAANVTGKLVVGNLPDGVAQKSDIPTVPANLSAFFNDCNFQDATGVTNIVGGVVTADFVNALGITVDAAHVTGKLLVTNLPDGVAMASNIPTNISSLINDSGYVPASNMTSIVGGIVTTDYVEALGIKVNAANITGKLVIGNMPDGVAQKTDIPTDYLTENDIPDIPSKLDDLEDYETDVTTIVEGVVTTDYLYALGVSATYLRGETVALDTAAGKTAGGIDITGARSSDYAVELYSNGALRLMAYGDWASVFIGTDTASLEVGIIDESPYDEWGLKIKVDTDIAVMGSGLYCGLADWPWEGVCVSTSEQSSSDRNKKNSISYDMEAYDSFFDKLIPAIYKMNNGTSGRYHVGMIAQDVEEALTETGLETTDFAGFIKSEGGNYALRYSEFIGLLIWQVQKLKARVAELEVAVNG